MNDGTSPAWAALKASLAPTFPQLQELEAGGALTMDLGSNGWVLELSPDGLLLCQYGMALDDVMTLLSEGTPEDLGTDEIEAGQVLHPTGGLKVPCNSAEIRFFRTDRNER